VKLLLDTHVFLWWLADPDRLSPTAHSKIASSRNRLFFSAASSWEIAIKHGLGKIHFHGPITSLLPRAMQEQAITPLPVEHAHAFHVTKLPRHHRDPFDRMLVAQAQLEKLAIVSADPELHAYDVEIVW
jgi:PIN domain nuclease of toxin-antitoxin system